jgi:hypothetical protein
MTLLAENIMSLGGTNSKAATVQGQHRISAMLLYFCMAGCGTESRFYFGTFSGLSKHD